MDALSLRGPNIVDAGAKPHEPFGKGSNALQAGARDAGPSGPTDLRRPSVQLPAEIDERAGYRDFSRNRKAAGRRAPWPNVHPVSYELRQLRNRRARQSGLKYQVRGCGSWVMKKLAIAILLLAASVASSQAASNWSGCYAGGNIGYSLGRAKTDTTFPNPTTTYSSANNLIGAVGGGQIGCNWLTSPAWLAGLEADIQWSGEDGSFQSNNPFFLVVTPGVTNFVGTNTVDATSKITWLGTARGRFGYLWNDMLMFATGGLAY